MIKDNKLFIMATVIASYCYTFQGLFSFLRYNLQEDDAQL